jgi:hypothetical protein
MRFGVAFLLCGSALLAQQNDWLIVPGKRLGPITADINRAGLVRLFGKRNVTDRDIDTGEGPEPATVVYPEDSTAELVVFWGDLRIGSVFVCFDRARPPCKWHTKEGVTLGTTFTALENLNGRPFEIVPWDMDYGGNVTDWKGGQLARAFNDNVATRPSAG